MGELPHFELSFQIPHSEKILQFQCDTRRIVEKDGEIQVGAVLIDPNKEELDNLQAYLN